MAKVVAVHGIGQQFKGEEVLRAEWLPSLNDGMRRAGSARLVESEFHCAFYGDLFRKTDTKAASSPPFDASDITDNLEQALLFCLWHEAARFDAGVPKLADDLKVRDPHSVQRALNALCRSAFWAGVLERLMIYDLKQVTSYFQFSDIRRAIRNRVALEVTEETRVLIGHSLGSIVAYECLCAHPDWKVGTFITLGSPLGLEDLIFERLDPPPRLGRGVWPGKVDRWINIADKGDIVASAKQLWPLFGIAVEDVLVHNGAKAHDVSPYLTTREAGMAVASGLVDAS